MDFSNHETIMQEISKTEEAIKSTYSRLTALEKKLQGEDLPETKQNVIEQELKEVRKLLNTHEAQLAHLRTHNRKTFVFVVALMFLIFCFYAIYMLIWGDQYSAQM